MSSDLLLCAWTSRFSVFATIPSCMQFICPTRCRCRFSPEFIFYDFNIAPMAFFFYSAVFLFSFPSSPPPPLTHTRPAVQWFRPLQPRQLPLPAQQWGELGVSHRLPLLPHPIITLHLHLQPHPIMATPRLSLATRLPSLLHAGAHDSIIKSAQLEGLFAHPSNIKALILFFKSPMLCHKYPIEGFHLTLI